ncbi:5-formyltetrahydrofolate cyclo-ligase [Hymenobacter lapidiphilus]|uniref:5-formyltetrahydrofolate cyclo-ligase n=1 Tax=Hymenobacter lapidiphilus TaxID=2608003 RepID=A0A7Y7U7L2_9BACT|nr:5-formyltetrahydrofolate cyclo-ligase [Hymenobacter lapidiphilus]NVO32640.1 5-formyltetrahydrofolate cyclo-ligase [Hymenobacter lapidiphilus]
MTKESLRRQTLARRRALSEAEVARRSATLWPQLLADFPVAAWRGLHLFLPIARQHEPDTWPLIGRLWTEYPNLQLAVPVVQPDGRTLRHYALGPNTPLTPNHWHIPEPAANAPQVTPDAFDAVLVPLLAFDETGHRVGYGKGFYDQFLAECRPDTLRIGVSLEPPVPRITDAWAGDVRLHACLTPEQLWRFG